MLSNSFYDLQVIKESIENKMVRCWKKLFLGSKNNQVDLIRRFGSDRIPHQ